MNVAAVQFEPAWEDRPANHDRLRRLLTGASLAPSTLVVLPEMFDVGFSMNTIATDPGDPSESEVFLRKLAAELDVAILAGVVARTNDGRLANEAVGYAPDGRELIQYRKRQPFTPSGEHTHYVAGVGEAMFEWQGVRISPFICYDLRFPEIFRPPAVAGAELFVVIANWPQPRTEHWVRLLQARAIENQAFVVGVNRCGRDPGYVYDGRSCAFDPQGNTIFEAGAREEVIHAEIDPDIAKGWREKFPALRDIRVPVSERS